jgi:hypothetical protein
MERECTAITKYSYRQQMNMEFVGLLADIAVVFPMFICDLYRRQSTASYGEAHMLETIAVLLIILWILGLVSSYTLGGFIHVLLVVAVIIILLRVIQGRSPV